MARARPKLEAVIAQVEKAKGRRWEEIRDWHGDEGRDLVLYVGQRVCGLKLGALAEAVEMNGYKAVSTAIRRYERRLQRSKPAREMLRRICQMANEEM